MNPAVVRTWIATPPGWLSIEPAPESVDAALATLDDGERAAISLAVATNADFLLMDDRAGVIAARALGLQVTGTLGILDHAAQRGLLDLAATFVALRATNFHVREDLLARLLSEDQQRRGQS
jgi:predicted nucleic acid-binding protein